MQESHQNQFTVVNCTTHRYVLASSMSIIWPSCFQRLSKGQITFHVRSQKQGNAGKVFGIS